MQPLDEEALAAAAAGLAAAFATPGGLLVLPDAGESPSVLDALVRLASARHAPVVAVDLDAPDRGSPRDAVGRLRPLLAEHGVTHALGVGLGGAVALELAAAAADPLARVVALDLPVAAEGSGSPPSGRVPEADLSRPLRRLAGRTDVVLATTGHDEVAGAALERLVAVGERLRVAVLPDADLGAHRSRPADVVGLLR